MAKAKWAEGVAVVTGATGGMGAEAARLLAGEGYALVLCDVDTARLEAVAAPLRAQGVKVDVLAGDITAADYPKQFLGAVGDRPIGAFIHTAGISPTMEARPERMLEVNLDGTIRLLDLVRPRMSEGSAAVLIASMAGHFAPGAEADAAIAAALASGNSAPLLPIAKNSGHAYGLSKRAVHRLAEREATAFGKRGARIVTISPGIIATGMGLAELEVSAMAREARDRTPLGRMGRGDEIASAAVFLCSPGASFISGCDLQVDGGAVAAGKA